MAWKKVGKNKYKIDVEKTIDGVRYRGGKRVTTELKGVQLKALMFSLEAKEMEKVEKKAGDPEKLRDMTFSEFSEYYISKKDIEQLTKDWYRRYLKKINKSIGNTKITKVSNVMIKNFFRNLEQEVSKTTNKPYSQKTKKHYLTVVRAIFNYALDMDVIDTNPTSDITIKVPRRTLSKNYYSPQEITEISDIINRSDDTRIKLMFYLAVIGGLRPAEVRGLKWGKINFDTKQMIIDESLVRTKVGYIQKSTKPGDRRVIDLTDYTILILYEHQENEKIKNKRLGIIGDLNDRYVITSYYGNHLSENNGIDIWRDFCLDHNIRYVTLYGLRHSSATLLAHYNIPVPDIANHLGHSSLSTTEIYIHAVEETKKKIKNIMEKTTNPQLKAME